MFSFLTDRKILLGLGIGMVLAGLIFMVFTDSNNYSKAQIEEKARGMGMVYSSEVKALQ